MATARIHPAEALWEVPVRFDSGEKADRALDPLFVVHIFDLGDHLRRIRGQPVLDGYIGWTRAIGNPGTFYTI